MTHLQITPFLSEPFTLDVERFLRDIDGNHDLPMVEELEGQPIDYDAIAEVLKRFA